MKPAVIALCFLPLVAQAQVFKCVASDGTTTYATVPCPEGTGETTRIIEPVPPSGVLSIPASAPAAVDEPQSSSDDDAGKAPSATGVTVIEDSDAAGRDQKRQLMRDEAEQRKKDSYDESFRRQEARQKQEELQRQSTR
ncbi:hypothetical protein ACVW0Y_004285 [Pseudomonas sp. TE3786]